MSEQAKAYFENFFTEFSTMKNTSIFAILTCTKGKIMKSIIKISIFDSVSNSANKTVH